MVLTNSQSLSYCHDMPQVPVTTPDGAAIRELRIAKGLTPDQLAKLAGDRHGSTIRGIESGHIRSASRVLVSQIARALGVTERDLTKSSASAA